MKNIFASGSKIVFILMALAAMVGFFIGKLDQGNFMILCGGAFTFYFTNKPSKDDSNPNQPFGGK